MKYIVAILVIGFFWTTGFIVGSSSHTDLSLMCGDEFVTSGVTFASGILGKESGLVEYKTKSLPQGILRSDCKAFLYQ